MLAGANVLCQPEWSAAAFDRRGWSKSADKLGAADASASLHF